MKIKKSDLSQVSDEKLKQVYFPVGNGHHLLSILSESGLMYELKERVNGIRFSEGNKMMRDAPKKKASALIEGEMTALYDITGIKYGGGNPQNISVLNSQNAGVMLLLSSLPPTVKKRPTQLPKIDFFSDCLWTGFFKNDFDQFHQVLSWRKNNKEIRDMRDDVVLNAMEKVVRLVKEMRGLGPGWSDSDTYRALPVWQKIWLDSRYAEIREDKTENQEYLSNAQSYFAGWFIGSYKQSINSSKLLGDADIDHIEKVLKSEQELLK